MKFLNTSIPFILAHRGISAHAPENTLPAITAVRSTQATWFECDVLLSAPTVNEPPHVFLLHDDALERTTSGVGLADQQPWSVLQKLDAGSWFHPTFNNTPIPLLRDVLDFLKTTDLSFNIELKALPGREQEWAQRVCETITTSGWDVNDPRLLFSSFSVPVLQALRQCAKDAHIAFLLHDFHDEENWVNLYLQLNCCSLNINHELLTADSVQAIFRKGIQFILAYTVDDPLRAHDLFSWGVSAVFSNDPDRIVLPK